MNICHITLTSKRDSRLALFANPSAYCAALHKLGRVCRGRLALFALIAEHLHLIALLSRVAAGRLARAVILALGPVVSTPLAPSRIDPVTTRSHMRWLLRYSLEQPIKHRMPGHPALWVGSCLPDLLGARSIPGLSLRIREALPDYSDRSALQIVRLPASELAPAGRATLRAAGAHRLARAAAAALGADPALKGNQPPTVLARRAAVHVAERVGIHRSEVAAALQVRRTNAWRIARREVARAVLLTVARRIALENLVQQQISNTPGLLPGPDPTDDISEVAR